MDKNWSGGHLQGGTTLTVSPWSFSRRPYTRSNGILEGGVWETDIMWSLGAWGDFGLCLEGFPRAQAWYQQMASSGRLATSKRVLHREECEVRNFEGFTTTSESARLDVLLRPRRRLLRSANQTRGPEIHVCGSGRTDLPILWSTDGLESFPVLLRQVHEDIRRLDASPRRTDDGGSEKGKQDNQPKENPEGGTSCPPLHGRLPCTNQIVQGSSESQEESSADSGLSGLEEEPEESSVGPDSTPSTSGSGDRHCERIIPSTREATFEDQSFGKTNYPGCEEEREVDSCKDVSQVRGPLTVSLPGRSSREVLPPGATQCNRNQEDLGQSGTTDQASPTRLSLVDKDPSEVERARNLAQPRHGADALRRFPHRLGSSSEQDTTSERILDSTRETAAHYTPRVTSGLQSCEIVPTVDSKSQAVAERRQHGCSTHASKLHLQERALDEVTQALVVLTGRQQHRAARKVHSISSKLVGGRALEGTGLGRLEVKSKGLSRDAIEVGLAYVRSVRQRHLSATAPVQLERSRPYNEWYEFTRSRLERREKLGEPPMGTSRRSSSKDRGEWVRGNSGSPVLDTNFLVQQTVEFIQRSRDQTAQPRPFLAYSTRSRKGRGASKMVRDFLQNSSTNSHPRVDQLDSISELQQRLSGRRKKTNEYPVEDDRVEIYWPEEQKWFPGTVVRSETDNENMSTVHYDDGDEEHLDFSTERFKIVTVEQSAKKVVPWADLTRQHVDTIMGDEVPDVEKTEIAYLLASALADATVGNYKGKVKKFFDFCKSEGLAPLPASDATALRYVAHLRGCMTVSADSFGVYFAAVNSLHRDVGLPAPLVGHLVQRMKRGVAFTQVDTTSPHRLYLPAHYVSEAHELGLAMDVSTSDREKLELFRAIVFLVVRFCFIHRGATGMKLKRSELALDDLGVTLAVELKGRAHQRKKPVFRLPKSAVAGLEDLLAKWIRIKGKFDKHENALFWALPGETLQDSLADDWLKLVLDHMEVTAPNGFKYEGHSSRSGAATAAFSIGVAEAKIKFWSSWALTGTTIWTYVDPSCPPTKAARRYFEWLLPTWQSS